MKKIIFTMAALLCAACALAAPAPEEQEYIQVDWYPLLTDSVGWNITSGGLALGFVSGADAVPDISMGKSLEISWLNVVGAKYNTGHGQRISLGIGIDWKNYKLGQGSRFVAVQPGIDVAPYPAGATPKSSRLKIFALEMPLILRQRFAKKWDAFVGGIANFNVRASMETIYTTAEGKVKESTTEDLRQTHVTFDVIGGVSYKKVGAYVRYSPCRVIKEGFGPKINSLSVGIVLGL